MQQLRFCVAFAFWTCYVGCGGADASCQLLPFGGDVKGYCSCKDGASGNVLSLARFAEPGRRLQVADEKYMYQYQPCLGFDVSDYTYVSLTQQDLTTSKYYNLGNASSISVVADSVDVFFVYSGSNSDGVLRFSYVHLICDEKTTKPQFVFQGQNSRNQPIDYRFSLTSDACCFQKSANLSVGSILVIVFFVLALVYVSGGLLYMRYHRGADGIEMIPNLAFWKDIPFLVKDGACFAVQRCRREPKGSVYDSI